MAFCEGGSRATVVCSELRDQVIKKRGTTQWGVRKASGQTCQANLTTSAAKMDVEDIDTPFDKLPRGGMYNGELFDVDCNLTHDMLKSLGVEQILQVARDSGVEAVLVPGSSVSSSREALELAKSRIGEVNTRIFATAGIHPYEVERESQTHESLKSAMRELKAMASDAAAIGECGLDFSEGFPEREIQMQWFEPQVALACEIGKPLFLHERLAHDDFIAVLSKFKHILPPVIVHCFTGNAEELQTYLDMGFSVSVSGLICREQSGQELRDAFAKVRPSLDKIMIETDAPYLGFPGCQTAMIPKDASAKIRKKMLKAVSPNVPSALPSVLETLAVVLQTEKTALSQATYENACSFFNGR